MAEKRIIASEIWQDDWYGSLPFFEKLLWIGLFSRCADDQGRLLDNAIVIRSLVFPYDDIPVSEIENSLILYASGRKIIRYESGGKRYIQIVNWWDHQQGQWATPSKHPAPEGWTDKVRSFIKGEYREENWDKKGKSSNQPIDVHPDVHVGVHPSKVGTPPGQSTWTHHLDTPPGQSTWTPHVAGHDPVPDPDLNPDLNPERDLIPAAPEFSPETRFLHQFLDILSVQFTKNEQAQELHELYETYGGDLLLEVAAWAAEKVPRNMGHALSMVRSAAATWKIKKDPPPREKTFAQRLAEA